jgi:hypothetical protein
MPPPPTRGQRLLAASDLALRIHNLENTVFRPGTRSSNRSHNINPTKKEANVPMSTRFPARMSFIWI